MYPPSMLASGCICAAVSGLYYSQAKALQFCQALHRIANLDLVGYFLISPPATVAAVASRHIPAPSLPSSGPAFVD